RWRASATLPLRTRSPVGAGGETGRGASGARADGGDGVGGDAGGVPCGGATGTAGADGGPGSARAGGGASGGGGGAEEVGRPGGGAGAGIGSGSGARATFGATGRAGVVTRVTVISGRSARNNPSGDRRKESGLSERGRAAAPPKSGPADDVRASRSTKVTV